MDLIRMHNDVIELKYVATHCKKKPLDSQTYYKIQKKNMEKSDQNSSKDERECDIPKQLKTMQAKRVYWQNKSKNKRLTLDKKKNIMVV